MIVVSPNAVDGSATMVVILDTTGLALGAVVHAGQFVDLTNFAVAELPLVIVG
jgi:hypothetical protein